MSEPDVAGIPSRAPDHRVALGITLTLRGSDSR